MLIGSSCAVGNLRFDAGTDADVSSSHFLHANGYVV